MQAPLRPREGLLCHCVYTEMMNWGMGKQVLGAFGPGKPLTIPRTHLRSWWPEGSVCSQVTHWPPWPSRVAIGLRVCRFQMCTSPLWALLRQVWVVPSTQEPRAEPLRLGS